MVIVPGCPLKRPMRMVGGEGRGTDGWCYVFVFVALP